MSHELRDIHTRGALVATAVGLLMIAVALGAYLFNTISSGIDKDSYQAVFLRNGQVYYGHLRDVGSDYATLTSAFTTVNAQQQPGATPAPSLALVNVSNDVSQPEQVMHISTDQIVHYENLKGDSRITQTINDALKQNK